MIPGPDSSALARFAARLRPSREFLGYAFFTVATFALALVYTLPHQLIARRVVSEATAEAPLRITFTDVSFTLPLGYHFENVQLVPRENPAQRIDVSEVTVWAPLLSVLTGNLGAVGFSGRLYGGHFAGDASNDAGTVTTAATFEDIDLASLSAQLLPAPGVIGGEVSLAIDLAGDGRTTRSSQGTIELSARDISLEGIVAQGFVVPDLRFAALRARAGLRGNRLEIETFEADGDELRLGAEGSVLIREPVDRSVLNLEVDIDVAADARPGLRVATSLLPPRPTGKPKRWSLRGSLAAPSLR